MPLNNDHLINTDFIEILDSDSKNPDMILSNEKVMFILQKNSGIAMYEHEFILGNLDPQLLSGFVGAMAIFLTEFIGSEEAQWKTVYGSDTTLIVEGGKWAVGVLAVFRETSELRSKLRMLIAEFEATFQSLQNSAGFEKSIFHSFDDFVMRIFAGDRITPNSRIALPNEFDEKPNMVQQSDPLGNLQTLLTTIEGNPTINQLAEMTGMHKRDVDELILNAFWQNAVTLIHYANLEDVLIPSERSLSVILSQKNHLKLSTETLRLVGALDGRKSLAGVMRCSDIDVNDSVLLELGNLLCMGYIQRASTEHKLVLSNERILNTFLRKSSSFVTIETVATVLRQSINNGFSRHPWLSRIHIVNDAHVLCLVDSNLSPNDLDDMYDALLYLINETSRLLSEKVAGSEIQAVLINARSSVY